MNHRWLDETSTNQDVQEEPNQITFEIRDLTYAGTMERDLLFGQTP